MFYFVDSSKVWIILGLAFAISCLSLYFRQLSGRNLALKFRSLGNMSGKKYSEIVSVVGAPTSEVLQHDKNGKTVKVATWEKVNFRVVLLFDENDVFIVIKEEEVK